MVQQYIKHGILGISPSQAYDSLLFKSFSFGRYGIREFDITFVISNVKYIKCDRSDLYLNVYTRNGRIFDVGRISN